MFKFIALMLFAAPALALNLEVSVGQSNFCCTQDGIWWQSQFGFTGHTRAQAWEVGVRQNFGNWSIAARYADLGVASGANAATMRDDDFGRFDTTKGCAAASQKNCLGYFGVSQHVAGAMLGGAWGFTMKGVRVDAEVGQFFYQSDVKVAIWCPNCGMDSRYAFGAGGTFTSSSDIRRSPYGSLRIEYNGITLTYRRITNVDGGGSNLEGIESQFATALTNGPVSQILIGAKF